MDPQDRIDQMVPKVTALEHQVSQAQRTASDAAEGLHAMGETMEQIKAALTGGVHPNSLGLIPQVADIQKQQILALSTLATCNAELAAIRKDLRDYRDAMPTPREMSDLAAIAKHAHESTIRILAYATCAGALSSAFVGWLMKH